MGIVKKIIELVSNKSFLLGVILAVGIFSKYIFGDDNLAEELAEVFVFESTGEDIDFSSDTKEDSNKNLNDIIKNHRMRH